METPNDNEALADRIEAAIESAKDRQVRHRCQECGKEWTSTQDKGFPIPEHQPVEGYCEDCPKENDDGDTRTQED